MTDFSNRSARKELIDRQDIPAPDIYQNMKELNIINTLLGGHRITISGLKKFIKIDGPLTILEIGCGGGDNLFAIQEFCLAKNIHATLVGVDINDHCIAYALQNKKLKAQFITDDYKNLEFEILPDVIFCSLFCHHFSDAEIAYMLKWMHDNSRLGFFINDLHRNPLAYYSIKLLTQAFSKSYLVKNDAPVSVLRGFSKTEWNDIFLTAGIAQFKVEWRWAFRHLVTCIKSKNNLRALGY